MTVYNRQFLHYLKDWLDDLPSVSLSESCPLPKKAMIISVDVINGFCTQGPLSSQRVQKIVEPIKNLFLQAWEFGINNIVLVQDTHEPNAMEFDSYPSHCVRGTAEAETVPEFKSLSFFSDITIIQKNSIHSGINTGLNDWIAAHSEVSDYIVVGDCTDLCIYQLAMHLKLEANARQQNRRVIIPANCIDTYDLSVAKAATVGAFPHDADLLHAVFLYHMALNGIMIVKSMQ